MNLICSSFECWKIFSRVIFSKNCCHLHDFPKVLRCMVTQDIKHCCHSFYLPQKEEYKYKYTYAKLWKNYGASKVHFCHLQLSPL